MSDNFLINEQITFSRVTVIDQEGRKLGEFLKTDALRLAEEAELDLVLVGTDSDRPICKIMDFDKFIYHQKKSEKKSSSSVVKIKEIEFKLQTDQGYIDIKTKQARKFLETGNKVKFATTLKGRETAHANIVYDRCLSIISELESVSEIEVHPKMSDRTMIMILVPKREK